MSHPMDDYGDRLLPNAISSNGVKCQMSNGVECQ